MMIVMIIVNIIIIIESIGIGDSCDGDDGDGAVIMVL